MNQSAIAKKYRQKNPDYSTLKLARIMYDDHPLLFNGVEGARSALRYIEGKRGDKDRKKVQGSPFVMEKERPKNPYNLPKSEEADYTPYRVTCKKAAILCDIHAPYHNEEALTAAIKWLRKEKVDTVIINGDLFDFHGMSRYMKDPRKKNFAYELDSGAAIIKILQKQLSARIVYKLGNHDERYQHFLWMKAGEIADVEDFQLKNLLIKRGCEIEIVEDKRIIQVGGLNVVHGHEFPSGIASPVNIARGFYLRGKTSVIGGHHHRTSEHTEQDMNGKITTAWSVGCLSELHPQYMPINSWNHGAAMVEVDGEDFQVHNKRIYKGRIL